MFLLDHYSGMLGMYVLIGYCIYFVFGCIALNHRSFPTRLSKQDLFSMMGQSEKLRALAGICHVHESYF